MSGYGKEIQDSEKLEWTGTVEVDASDEARISFRAENGAKYYALVNMLTFSNVLCAEVDRFLANYLSEKEDKL